MLVSLWAAAEAVRDPRRRSRWLVVSGIAASAVVYFKLVYGIIPVAMWLATLWGGDAPSRSRARRDLTTLLTASVAPLVPLVVYFAHERIVGTMWWTYVTYPPKVVRSLQPPPLSRLTSGTSFFLEQFAWLLVVVVAVVALRPRDRRFRAPDDPLLTGVALWFVLGWFTVVVQNQWAYQFMLPVVPLGLLATVALDRLVSRYRQGRLSPKTVQAVAGITALLLIVPLSTLVNAAGELVASRFAVTAAGRDRFRDATASYYLTAESDAAWVSAPGRAPGAIQVEGDPLVQYLARRPLAMREHGWAAGQSDARLWRWTQDGLRDDRPVYLFVDDATLGIMESRSPSTVRLVDSLYCKADRTVDGEWYALAGSSDCSG